MNHLPGATDVATSTYRQIYTDIFKQNVLFVQKYKDEINTAKDEYS